MKDALPKKGESYQRVDGDHLTLAINATTSCAKRGSPRCAEAQLDTAGIAFHVQIAAHAD